MSIASEITRINNNIASAYDECETKGATMPVTENSANLATTIASIPSGGGGADLDDYFDKNISKNTENSRYPRSFDNLVKKLPTLTFTNGVTSLKYYFYDWPFSHLAFDGIDCSNITDMSYAFASGSSSNSLTSIDLLNITNTNNLYNVTNLFYNQKKLVEINNMFPITPSGSNFFIVEYAFYNCESLIRLDLSNWVGKCLSPSNMFQNAKKLAVLDISNLQLAISAANLSYAFSNCGINCLQSDGAYADGIPYIYVKDATEQSKVLGATGTPSTWSTNNVVIKQTPSN